MRAIKFLALAGFLSSTGFATAQDRELDNREKFKLGVKAGMNYSNVYNSKTDDFKADGKFGFTGGLQVAIPIGKYFGIQPEFLLSQKGFKGKGTFLGSEYSFTRTTTFVDIPLQFAFKPSEFITLVAGPQYSYLIKQKDVFNSAFINTTQEQEFKNENIRRNIFGFVGGFDITLKHILIGTRVGWDMMTNNGDGSSSTPKYKNVWLQATIGYNFYKK
jgi:hypothetical protein